MRISTLGYTLKQGVINLKRNKIFTLASIGTICACIFLVSIFISVGMNVEIILNKVEKSVGISVFFDETLNKKDIDKIGELIKKNIHVENITYISGDQAWENFKNEYFKGDLSLSDGFKDDNPLENSDSYEVEIDNISSQKDVVIYIESIKGVRKINRSDIAAENISGINKAITYIFIGISGLLLLISIFLISNTVMLGIAVRKEEIRIMQYIGAKDWFVKGPFLIEGIVIGLVGAIIPLTVMYFIYNKIVHYIIETYSGITEVFSPASVGQIYNILLPVSLLLGVGIGIIGSYMAINKYLDA